MPVVQNTLLQLDGVTPLIGRKVTVGLVGTAFAGATQDLGFLASLTDQNGRAAFTLAPSGLGSYYVWTNPDGTQYRFAVPSSGAGPFNLVDVLVNVPAALPYVPIGVTSSSGGTGSTGTGTGGSSSSANLTYGSDVYGAGTYSPAA